MSLRSGSRAFAHRRTLVLGLASVALAGFVSPLSPAARARDRVEPLQEAPEGYTQGIPWTGAPGITETVAEIMERERLAPKVARGLIQVAKPESSEWRKRQRLGKNPAAPATSRWPILDRAVPAPELYNPQTVGTSFDGAVLFTDTFFIPPDSMGDVGPTQILVIINGRIRVFNKAGVVGGLNVTTNTFFSSVSNGQGTSDPHVRYDRLSQRWFITMVNVPSAGPNRILLAVSSGPTITNTSSFTFFQFQSDGPSPAGDTNGFADYDTLGVDQFALYIGVNMFDQAGTTFLGTTGYVVRKSDLITGTLTVTAFRQMAGPTCGPVTPQGVSNDDPAATEGYFIGVDLCNFGTLQIRRIINPGGTPSISPNLTVTAGVPATSFPIDQVQPAGGPVLDALDDRLFAAAIHKNKITGATTLWTAHNIQVDNAGNAVDCFPNPSCPGGRNGSRWYEIGSLTTTPALLQAGTLFDTATTNPLGYWIPSVALSGQGHMAIGTSRAGLSASNGFASVTVAGRLRTDAAGATQAPTLAQSSSFSYDVHTAANELPRRWGDYSQVGVDPNDDMTMWTFQEYANATNSYAVRAIQLVAPPPATPASASPGSVLPGQPSVNVTITGTSSGGSEFFDPGADPPLPAQPYNHISASVPGVIVNSTTFNSPTQVTLNISTVGATAGAKNVTITNPDGQSRTGTGILTITPTMSINDVTMAEGNSGTTPFVFTVSLSAASGQTITVNYATADGTATAGSDYTAVSGMLTFPPGTTSLPITVLVNGDTTFEPDETFFVNLTAPVNVTITKSQGVGTIVNDDTQPTISVNDRSVVEGDTGANPTNVMVTLSNASFQTITVAYATADGTATAGSDYTAVSGTLTFPPFSTSQPIPVPIIGNTVPQPNRTFFVNLTSPTNATIARPQGTVTILDDDSPLQFFSLTPCRVVNTRNPNGPSGGPALAANSVRNFPAAGQCGIPADARAISVVITTVLQTDFGDLRLYPADAVPPTASTINFAVSHTRANNAIIPLGTAGQVSVQCDMPPGSTGTTHFLMDVYGYFK